MSVNILAPSGAYVILAAVVLLIAVLFIAIIMLIRSHSEIRRTLERISRTKDALCARSVERKKETAVFVAEIENIQKGGTAATKAVERLINRNCPPLSKQGMEDENALTAALFPLYVQEKSYPELYCNEKVSAATESLKVADSAFESERKAYNEACATFAKQTSTRSGRIVARMHKYLEPTPFPDP